MAKITKAQLTKAYDTHTQFIRGVSAAVGAEKGPAIEIIKGTGTALIALLAQPMRATVDAELIAMCERAVDRSALIIGKHEFA